MADNDSSLINEIINFLQSDRKDVLEMATESALSACSDLRNAEYFINNKSTVSSLLRLINYPGRIGYASLACLLNLTSLENQQLSTIIINDIIQNNKNGVNRLLEIGLSYRNVITTNITNAACSGIDKENREHVHHAMSLLCNLTRNNKDGVMILIDNDSNVIKMKLLLSRFFSTDYVAIVTTNNNDDKKLDDIDANNALLYLQDEVDNDDDDAQKEIVGDIDPYQHVSSILQNITQFDIGCQFLISNKDNINADDTTTTRTRIPNIIQSMFNEIHTSSSSSSSTNALRRRNCAGTIKNICMEASNILPWFEDLNSNNDDNHNSNISTNGDNICYYLLYPLMSSTDDYLTNDTDEDIKLLMHEFILLMNTTSQDNKIREIDHNTRLVLIETILILCSSGRKIRESLRSYGAYHILRNVDLQEENEDVSNVISDCVQFLRRDEDGMPDGSSDIVALQIARERRKKEKELEEEFNDVD